MQLQTKTESFQSYITSNISSTNFSVRESVDAFLKPCARFLTPLSWSDRLELKLLQWAADSKIFTHIRAVPDYEISPNWQILLNYLASKNILSKPAFIRALQRNDFPHNLNKVVLTAELSSTITDGHTKSVAAFGSATELEDAYSKAVGELLERYTMSLYRTNDLKRASFNELSKKGNAVLDLDLIPNYLPWQREELPELVSSKETKFNWEISTELISGRKTYVPAQLIFWNYNTFKTQEPWLQQPTTNGEAGGFTFEESVLASIYEKVERDAFLIFWLNTIAPPRIALKTIDNTDVQARISALENKGLKVVYLDTTTDLEIPSCVCVVIDERGADPRIAIGGSAGFNIQKNLVSSLNEAVSVAQHPVEYSLSSGYKPFLEKKIGREERVGLWHGKDMLDRFNFFISGKEIAMEESRLSIFGKVHNSKKDELDKVKMIFKNKGEGYELYCYRVGHFALDILGYEVTKVIIPKLVPLHLNEHLATLDAERLRTVPALLGYTETRLNPWPHPFS